MQLHETFNERQAHAETAATSVNAVIGLGKGLKNIFHHILLNAYSRVMNGQENTPSRIFDQTNGQSAAAIRELCWRCAADSRRFGRVASDHPSSTSVGPAPEIPKSGRFHLLP